MAVAGLVEFPALAGTLAEDVLCCRPVARRVPCDPLGNIVRIALGFEDRDVVVTAVYEGSTRKCTLRVPRVEWRSAVEVAYVAVMPEVPAF